MAQERVKRLFKQNYTPSHRIAQYGVILSQLLFYFRRCRAALLHQQQRKDLNVTQKTSELCRLINNNNSSITFPRCYPHFTHSDSLPDK